jgi:hypothetical protein
MVHVYLELYHQGILPDGKMSKLTKPKIIKGRFNIPVLKLMLRTILFKIKKHKSDNPLVNIQFSLKQNVHLGNNQQCMNENK